MFTFTYSHLSFSPPTRPPHPLPPTIQRFYTQTPSGKIEILYAAPRNASGTQKTPIFFIHGGMGGAWVWLEYLDFLSARGIPCYAVSMRGHGDSWMPSFLRLTYFTTKRMLADDVVSGIKWAEEREGGQEVVLVGHSSGGGLAQYILNEGRVRVKGLVLAGAVPGFGSFGVYMNWFRLDPWFSFRMIFHGWHPNSPLSHPRLVRGVFFSEELDEKYVQEFQTKVSFSESFWWPLTMGHRFVDPRKVLRQITGWGTGQRVMVLRGEVDKIMDKVQMVKLADFYRVAFASLVGEKKIEAIDEETTETPGEGGQDNIGHGVRLNMVPKAGHHLQNDVTWELGAAKLLAFHGQL
ncbi:hypothetical protein OQA88_12073 [Cercophora sp. LCS_1]